MQVIWRSLPVRSLSLAIIVLLISAAPASAQPVDLGTAADFGALAGTTVTNTGPTVVNGFVGVSPGTEITGFGPGGGTATAFHSANLVAAEAQADLLLAYDSAAGAACNPANNLTGQNLGSFTLLNPLTPGVYCFSSDALLTGTLTLDFQGDPDAVFIFQIGTALNTATGSSVVAINNLGGLCPPNIFWQVGSSAILETTTTFLGNILALTSITLRTGASLNGRALARNGQVALDTNTINACAAGVGCPPITVNPADLPNGILGTPYNQTVIASPAGTYTYTVSTDVLPPGLVLNPATGAITGTPTTAGIFDFTITAMSAGCSGSRPYSITIPGAAVTVGVPTLDFLGLAILFVLLAGTGLFVISRV